MISTNVKSVAVCADNTELGQQIPGQILAEENGLEFKERFFTPRRGGFDQRGAAVKVPESGRPYC